MSIPRLAFAAAALSLAACAPKLTLRHKTEPLAQPWTEAKPSLLVTGVSDRSGGYRWGMFGGVVGHATFAKPLEDSVREAVTGELQALGVTLASTPEQADARLSVSVSKVETTWGTGYGVKVNSLIELVLSFRDRAGKAVLWDVPVAGTGHERIFVSGKPGAAPERTLSVALGAAMARVRELFLSGDVTARLGAGAAEAVAAAPAVEVRSDVDTVPAVAGVAPRRAHAVVVGVERYRAALPAADFAASDARLFGRYLVETLGFPKENVAVLVNQGAAKSDFEKFFEKWLANRVEKDDEVFVYFSGHGAPDPSSGDSYLVPYDGDPTYLDQTAYPLKKLYASLGALPAKQVTVVLDSCFSGAGGRSVLAKGARPLVAARADAALPANVTVMAAAAGNQISNTFHAKGHGLFTYFMLKGLTEQAGRPVVDWEGVFVDARRNVKDVARKEYNLDQEPQMREGK